MFSNRLKQLRKDHGITQMQFAQEFNISKGTIGMWEIGKREPDFETATRIADYFHVSVDYLLGRDEEKPTPENGDGLSAEQMELVRLFELAAPALRVAALAVLKSGEPQDKALDEVSKDE